eukprot:TRINITY_DN70499_c0_g1_i1.p1 TRINITY_DN70499_c0_g1~~TRINITY_DN70499_c0_g1_i1.p1  ORF type:complete len:195 (-),score=34.62 TRINITY_DN70499_c0_g1_i1:115-699(-)
MFTPNSVARQAPATRQPHQRGRFALAATVIAAAALLSTSWLSPAFVPPPLAAFEATRSRGDALQLLDAIAKDEIAYVRESFQENLEDCLLNVNEALEDFANNDDLIGPSENPQLITVGVPLPPKKDLLKEALKPVTVMMMRWQKKITPRCPDCKIVIRWGKIYRTCTNKRHKARNSGIKRDKRKYERFLRRPAR